MILSPQSSIQIQKPISAVFEAIVDPQHMSQYFISESSGRLQTGIDLLWKFPEFDEEFPITQIEVDAPTAVSFVWDPETKVSIALKKQKDGSTVVKVMEEGKEVSEKNITWALENASGWGNFLACLKAYLEYGIQLRKGAFEFMRSKNF